MNRAERKAAEVAEYYDSITNGARTAGIIALVTGILGLLFLPIIFGPIALISGIIAVSLRAKMGWGGIILGAIQCVIVANAFIQLSNALDALETI